MRGLYDSSSLRKPPGGNRGVSTDESLSLNKLVLVVP
jgi:hypothetical protein